VEFKMQATAVPASSFCSRPQLPVSWHVIDAAWFHFIEHYTENGVDEDSLAAFKQRLGEIGNILIDRIGREERVLYRLYTAPPDAV